MAKWRQAVELAMTDEEIEVLTALSRSRTEPASRVSRARCCWPIARTLRSLRWGNGLGCTIRRSSAASNGRWAMGPGGARGPAAAGQGTHDHAGGQSLVGIAGVRQGQGPRLSARVVDDAAFGPSCARARPGGGSRLSRQAGSRHGVQDPRPGGNQAAQGALLSGTSRCRVRAEDGRGSVRLS